MQKIILEKNIDLHHQLKELVSLSVEESINYKMENEGIRAVGSLMIKGEYKDDQTKHFEEIVDLDVLATFDKIVDQRDFCIKVEDFDYSIKEGNIFVSIEAGVHGVVQGQDRYIQESSIDEIEDLIRQEQDELIVEEELTQEVVEIEKDEVKEEFKDETESLSKVVYESKVTPTKEEQIIESKSKVRSLFEDTTESIGVYYMYIVTSQDTYESISVKYNVNETLLRNYNKNKSLDIGEVLIIPYAP